MLETARNRVRTRLAARGVSKLSRDVRESGLTYLTYRKLRNLERCVKAVSDESIPGTLLEAGVALGGSAIVVSSLMPAGRVFRGYDVFEMIPPPGERDDEHSHERYDEIASGKSGGINGERYYGYQEGLYETVVGNFASYGLRVDGERISLHRGLFEDTMELDGQAVALAHLDCDWYDSVQVCLDRIYPSLSPGGFILSDDYYNYGGCARAIDEFLADHRDMRKIDDRQGPPDGTANVILRRDPD